MTQESFLYPVQSSRHCVFELRHCNSLRVLWLALKFIQLSVIVHICDKSSTQPPCMLAMPPQSKYSHVVTLLMTLTHKEICLMPSCLWWTLAVSTLVTSSHILYIHCYCTSSHIHIIVTIPNITHNVIISVPWKTTWLPICPFVVLSLHSHSSHLCHPAPGSLSNHAHLCLIYPYTVYPSKNQTNFLVLTSTVISIALYCVARLWFDSLVLVIRFTKE